MAWTLLNEFIHGDCMDYMKDMPDNAFDLAIVDPPYGIGRTAGSFGTEKAAGTGCYQKRIGTMKDQARATFPNS